MSNVNSSCQMAIFLILCSRFLVHTGYAQQTFNAASDVRKYFVEQKQAYESADTLDDAVAVAKRRLEEQGQPEYAAIIDVERMKEAISKSVDWWDDYHKRAEQRDAISQADKEIIANSARHYRQLARPQYESIIKANKWPDGAYFLIQGSNKPGAFGLVASLIIDARNADGTGFRVGEGLPALEMHSLELIRLDYGRFVPKTTGNNFKSLATETP